MRFLLPFLLLPTLVFAQAREAYIEAFKHDMPMSKLAMPSEGRMSIASFGLLGAMASATLPAGYDKRYNHDQLLLEGAERTNRMMKGRGFDDELTLIYLNSPAGRREIRAQYVSLLMKKCYNDNAPDYIMNVARYYFTEHRPMPKYICPSDKTIAEKAFK